MTDDQDLPPLDATPAGLYRHYKGGWYEVVDTVRCSETLQGMTLYRALYGAMGLWVRPASMFAQCDEFQGRHQPRFTRHDPATLAIQDTATAHALVAHLKGRALREHQIADLDAALRPPPPAPTSCCGRGCNGCVWEGFYLALHHWRLDALALLGEPPKGSPNRAS